MKISIFDNNLLNIINGNYCFDGNLIELYTKIKYYGNKKGIFLSNNPFDTYSYTDSLFEISNNIWPELNSYNYYFNEPGHLGFIFNVKFYVPENHINTFCKIIADAINNA